VDRFLNTVYIARSVVLDKTWVVKAKDIDSATNMVLKKIRPLLSQLESNSLGEDIDLDLSFSEVKNITEI